MNSHTLSKFLQATTALSLLTFVSFSAQAMDADPNAGWTELNIQFHRAVNSMADTNNVVIENGENFEVHSGTPSNALYQLESDPIPVVPQATYRLTGTIDVRNGGVSVAFLNTARDWFYVNPLATAASENEPVYASIHRTYTPAGLQPLVFERTVPLGETVASAILRASHARLDQGIEFSVTKLRLWKKNDAAPAPLTTLTAPATVTTTTTTTQTSLAAPTVTTTTTPPPAPILPTGPMPGWRSSPTAVPAAVSPSVPSGSTGPVPTGRIGNNFTPDQKLLFQNMRANSNNDADDGGPAQTNIAPQSYQKEIDEINAKLVVVNVKIVAAEAQITRDQQAKKWRSAAAAEHMKLQEEKKLLNDRLNFLQGHSAPSASPALQASQTSQASMNTINNMINSANSKFNNPPNPDDADDSAWQ